MSYPLTYVCGWCGQTCGVFPSVKADAPAVLSVCDRRSCREAASAEWKSSCLTK